MRQLLRFYSLGIICLILSLISFNCKNDSIGHNKHKASTVSDFPNVLDNHGVPDSSADRSVYIFSDLGAWHGYALPDKASTTFNGSFIGPYIMTQDNGVWLGKSLSKLEIVDQKNKLSIDLQNAKIVENSSYPNKLLQVLEVEYPKVMISTELIFLSERTAAIKLNILNLESDPLELMVRWKEESPFKDHTFTSHDNGVRLNFKNNKNIGWLSTSNQKEHQFTISPYVYKLEINNFSVQPNQLFETYITHTFCFSEKERLQEVPIINNFLADPKLQITKNESRWNKNLNEIFTNLKEGFRTKSHQSIAVKCLQTLNNNWKSSAGALKHDGLFPSYNYEWFNGFWSWDSWKHAVAIAQYDTELAQEQIKAMYHFQDEKGMIADCVYRDNVIEENNWRDTKPPLSAWAT